MGGGISSASESASPRAVTSGFRNGFAAHTLLSLSCNGEQRTVSLSGVGNPLRDDQLLSEHDGVRSKHLTIRRANTLYLRWDGELQTVNACDPLATAGASHGQQGGLTAPMNGSIVRVLVEVGQSIEAGTQLVVLEAMKMEHSVRAPRSGIVNALYCQEGDMVGEGAVLVELT